MLEEQKFTSDDGSEYTKLKYSIDDSDEKVGIIYGHFAPFTGPNGHGRMLKALQDVGCEKFIVGVAQNKQKFDDDRQMFTTEQRCRIAELGAALSVDGDVHVIDYKSTLPQHLVGRFVKIAYREFGPHIRPIFCFGPDRGDFSGLCVEYDSDPSTTRCEYVVMKDRGDKDVSGTMIRNLIREGDVDEIVSITGLDENDVEDIIDMRNANYELNKKN